MLEVVKQQEELLAPQELIQVRARVADPLREFALRVKLRCDCGSDHSCIVKASEPNPENTVGIPVGEFRGGLQREPGLSRSPGTGECEQPNVVASEQVLNLLKLALATKECSGRDWQVYAIERPERRKLCLAELEEPLRLGHVL